MNETAVTFEIEKPDRKYPFTRIDFFGALTALVLGFLSVCVVPVDHNPLGAMLYVILLYASATAFIYCSGKRLDGFSFLLGAVGILFSAGFIVSSAVLGWLFLGEMLLYIYFVYSAFGNHIEDKVGRFFWFDAVKSAIVMPFSAFDALFRALAPSKKDGVGKKIASNIPWVISGLTLAIVPTIIIGNLLNYDNSLEDILFKISNAFDFSMLSDVFGKLLLTVPVALYGFGHFTASKFCLNRDTLDAEDCGRLSEKVRFLPTVLSVTAMLPILALYVIFFISQWEMYMAAFTGVRPDALSYAEYARQGFFELCAVCGINAALMLAVTAFTKKNTRASDVTLRIMKGITALFSIVLAATALSKMILYIGAYGLTLKRVLASWLIILLLVVFVLVIFGQIIRRFRFHAALLVTFALLFGGLIFCDVPTLIAEHNTDAYLTGKLEFIDTAELYYACDEAGIPSLVRLAESAPDATVREDAERLIESYKLRKAEEEKNGERGFFSFSVVRAKADHAVE